MHIIADLHLHSRYSRAVSKDMNLETMASWAQRKGLDLLAAADFTHPAWFGELKEKLSLDNDGLYQLNAAPSPIRFILSTELSCIYSQGGKTRRIHLVVILPTLEDVQAFNLLLLGEGANLRADGRPILGMSAEHIVELARKISDKTIVIPAHIWTPWFSMFGSMSGFDSVEECFGKQAEHIHAVETGLSSDPPMNWRLSQLDRMTIVSSSDSHSPARMGRESTVFELEKLSYDSVRRALETPTEKNRIAMTVEFFPEEGRYHWDGHRNCNTRMPPAETKKLKGICPVCKKKLTIGVLYRVDQLADRPEGYQAPNRPPYRSLVPLQEIIGDALGFGSQSKKVTAEYDSLVHLGKSEFNVLLHLSPDELKAITTPQITEVIQRVRNGKLTINPGYDGEYGTVKVFTDAERKKFNARQEKLL